LIVQYPTYCYLLVELSAHRNSGLLLFIGGTFGTS